MNKCKLVAASYFDAKRSFYVIRVPGTMATTNSENSKLRINSLSRRDTIGKARHYFKRWVVAFPSLCG